MEPFFELRTYNVFENKMDDFVNLMEKEIIPFQVSKGMIIHGSFMEKSINQFYLKDGNRLMDTNFNRNKYIWIRRFENSEHKIKLYKRVYESKKWIEKIGPKVNLLIDRNSITVQNLFSTHLSIMK